MLEVIVTSKCPLRCGYCFEDKREDEPIDQSLLAELMSGVAKITVFGGEPLANPGLLESILRSPNASRLIITNGVLIPQNGDMLLRHNCECQISIDGPREATNMNRRYPNGEGAFDDIYAAILYCRERGIRYSLHGVLTQNTLPMLSDTIRFFYEDSFCREKDIDAAISRMGRTNHLQVNFEVDWTDEDVDRFISELEKTTKWILSLPLPQEKRKALFEAVMRPKGGTCGAGYGYMTLGGNKLYPCHRYCQTEAGEKFSIENRDYWNSLSRLKFSYMYSSCSDIKNGVFLPWQNWCPCANEETSGNIYYRSAKYSVLMAEVGRAVEWLRSSYFAEEDIAV